MLYEVITLAKHKALKTSKKVQIPFSEEELNLVLEELSEGEDFEGLRDKLMVELFYATGIRRIELIQIKMNDLDLHNKTLKVLGKRNKERYIPLINTVIDSLNRYMVERNALTTIKDKERNNFV